VSRGLRPPEGHSITRLLTRRDLEADDLTALRELIRFGVMADDQLARRYADPVGAYQRLPLLKDGGLVFRWREPLGNSRVYSPTRLGQHLVRVRGLDARKPSPTHLAHDVALVDLADFLLEHHPGLAWRTEREVRPFLDEIGPRRPVPGNRPHRPDGLLLAGGERIAIELEHSDKYEQRYIRISQWFVGEWRLDRVRWYVDSPRIVDRLRQVNSEHGFDRDMLIEIEPFPPGVVFRKRPGLYET
jgi:hypothetical protein